MTVMHWKDHIQTVLDTLPEKPGCYLMKDVANNSQMFNNFPRYPEK